MLAGIDFNDERKLGDAKQPRRGPRAPGAALLADRPAEREPLRARHARRAYEYLIEKFADDAGKKGGEFYTPNQVVRLLVALLEPKAGMRICDPTCGSGGMLVQSAHYIVEHGGDAKNVSLFGQEKNLGTWAICKMNMLLHGCRTRASRRATPSATRSSSTAARSASSTASSRTRRSPSTSGAASIAENDPYGRFRFGVPPKTKGDLAFVQHMVASLNATGMVGVVMPHGVLFRGAAEGEIRKGMLEEDLVEAVIGLPSNLFYGTGIPAAILVLNRRKAERARARCSSSRRHASSAEGSAQNYLRDEDVRKIAATFHAFKDVEKYARVVEPRRDREERLQPEHQPVRGDGRGGGEGRRRRRGGSCASWRRRATRPRRG